MLRPELSLSPEQLQAQYGLEPTTVENLKASQEAYKKMGLEMSLEEVFFLEFDKDVRDALEQE